MCASFSGGPSYSQVLCVRRQAYAEHRVVWYNVEGGRGASTPKK